MASPSPAISGQTVTLTATVAPRRRARRSARVSFYNGETLLGMGTVNFSGVATLSTSTLPPGADSLTAVYSGNTTSATSSSPAVMETISAVTLAVTTTTIAAPTPALAGQLVTFTATVAPTPTGAPLGSVSFYNGATLLGMGTVSVSGVATFTTSSLPAGSDTLTAALFRQHHLRHVHLRRGNENECSYATATTVILAPNPPVDGLKRTFTATVASSADGRHLGTVSFFSGATLLGMGTVNSSGVATFTGFRSAVWTCDDHGGLFRQCGFGDLHFRGNDGTVAPGFTVVGPTSAGHCAARRAGNDSADGAAAGRRLQQCR